MIKWVAGDEKMASRYEFTEEQIEELTKAAKENKEKNVDKRLRTLLMRAISTPLAVGIDCPDGFHKPVQTVHTEQVNIQNSPDF